MASLSYAAIVKPDHVGDFVLSIPAIKFLASRINKVDLFVQTSVVPFARVLLPTVDVYAADFPHLSRAASISFGFEPSAFAKYDAVFVLRRDGVLDDGWRRNNFNFSFCVANDDDQSHETWGHASQLGRILGSYDPCLFRYVPERPYPHAIRKVGLSIAAGFTANLWPWANWVELYRKLSERGVECVFIGGPSERDALNRLTSLLDIPFEAAVIGTSDILSFLNAIQELDVVVSTDGGTGHLCSLSTNVVSLQMSGSWRRFSPFGSQHRTITRDLHCAPCLNFDARQINLCASRECSYLLLPDHVVNALFLKGAKEVGTIAPLLPEPRANVIFGASHIKFSETQAA